VYTQQSLCQHTLGKSASYNYTVKLVSDQQERIDTKKKAKSSHNWTLVWESMFNNETLYESEQGGFKSVKKATIQLNCKVPAYYTVNIQSLSLTVPFCQVVYVCLIVRVLQYLISMNIHFYVRDITKKKQI